MRGVLNTIIAHKKNEVRQRKSIVPMADLLANRMLQRQGLSMRASILGGSGVIAEFKRASPSKGVIREGAVPREIASLYARAGASGISVLTDSRFFMGSDQDLQEIRAAVELPVLRKDFIIDPYQVFEAKAMGADCILLIASVLKKAAVHALHRQAEDLGLEVLVEIHEEQELDKLSGDEKLIGINNRNLDTFEVDIQNSIRLAGSLPEAVKIAESGLGNQSDLKQLREAGFKGFLVGESFMKADDPGMACSSFIAQLR